MNDQKKFQALELSEQLLLIGQALGVLSTTFLSFGQVIRLLSSNSLPSYPINEHVNTKQEQKHSYFN